jgi:hypothetical protein
MDDMKTYMETAIKDSVAKYMEGMMGDKENECSPEDVSEDKAEQMYEESEKKSEIPAEFLAKYQEMEEKVKLIEAEKDKERALRIETEDKTFVDSLVKSSKLAPALAKKAFALLNNSSEELVVSYSDGENEVSKSQKEQFKDFLNSLPKDVLYSEEELAETTDDLEGITVTAEDRKLYGGRSDQEIMIEKRNTAKVYKYMEENSCSFEQAVELIFKK